MYSSSAITAQPWWATQFSFSAHSIKSSSNRNPFFQKLNFIHFYGISLRRPNSVTELIFGVSNGCSIYTSSSSKPFFRPVMEWQDCTVKMEVDVPASVAYNCYSDREAIPQWMPFISSVQMVYLKLKRSPLTIVTPRLPQPAANATKSALQVDDWPHKLPPVFSVLEDKRDLSRWTLKYKAFGRNIEFSWLARNLQPIRNQKIHWRSLEGLPNRGVVRFYPKGASSCLVELTVSYEVPQLLVPVASALQPFLQSLLMRGLERFTNFAKSYQPDSTT